LSRDRLELGAVFALLLAIVWRAGAWIAPNAEGAANAVLGAAAAAIVLLSWRRTGASLASLGLAPDRAGAGLASAALVSLGAAAVLAALGAALGTLSSGAERVGWLADYLPGIAAQQVLLQGFFAPGVRRAVRAERPAAGDGWTIAITALAFAALHAPNPALMLGTALAGAFWVAHFFAHRSLLAVLASHLVLGVAAMATLGPGPMLNLRVGPGAWELLSR
jgi:hypothetical protein